MSALTFSHKGLLVGKFYEGSRGSGIILQAEDSEAWYGRGISAYKVRVRPEYKGDGIYLEDFWATVAVEC